MTRILVAHASLAGSTAEVAEHIVRTVSTDGVAAESHPASEITTLEGYDAVIVAAPMIIGWHRAAQLFLAQLAEQLAALPVAYCIMCYTLTDTGAETVQGVPVTVDPQLQQPPQVPGRLSFKERQTTASAYLQSAFKRAPQVKPVAAGFFKGVVDYSKLSLFSMLFLRLVIRAESGDYRDWDAITAWAEDVRGKLVAAR